VPAAAPEASSPITTLQPPSKAASQPTATADTPPPDPPTPPGGQYQPGGTPVAAVDLPWGNPNVQAGKNGASPQPGGASTPATGAGGLPDVAAQTPWAVGESRPFQLHVHCGIRTAKIGAELWVVTGPVSETIEFWPAPDQQAPPPATGAGGPSAGDTLTGTMTLAGPFLARFTSGQGQRHGTAEFAPPSGPVALCR